MRFRNFVFAMFVFAGCSGNDAAVAEAVAPGTIITDSATSSLVPVQADTAERKSPIGIYGTLWPCANCDGKSYTVGFYGDSSFVWEESGAKNNEVVTKAKGSWKYVNHEIQLSAKGKIIGRYVWKKDTLVRTDLPVGPINFERKPAASENKTWQQKGNNGAEFFGVGNEPFWSIEIDEQKEIVFQLADWDRPLRMKSAVPVVSADSVLYKFSNDSTFAQVTIHNRFCSDGMSDYIYENTVEVSHNGTVYKGCGMFFK